MRSRYRVDYVSDTVALLKYESDGNLCLVEINTVAPISNLGFEVGDEYDVEITKVGD